MLALIVVDSSFSRVGHVERFRNALRSQASVSLFMLWAPLEIVRAREAQRLSRERLGQQVVETWTDLAHHRAELGVLVDATAAPETVAAAIQEQLAANQVS